jgi:hypothetical protein
MGIFYLILSYIVFTLILLICVEFCEYEIKARQDILNRNEKH